MSLPTLPEPFATSTNYSTGPDVGTPTKVDPGPQLEGHIAGAAAKPSAQHENWRTHRVVAHVRALGGYLTVQAQDMPVNNSPFSTPTGCTMVDNSRAGEAIGSSPSPLSGSVVFLDTGRWEVVCTGALTIDLTVAGSLDIAMTAREGAPNAPGVVIHEQSFDHLNSTGAMVAGAPWYEGFNGRAVFDVPSSVFVYIYARGTAGLSPTKPPDVEGPINFTFRRIAENEL